MSIYPDTARGAIFLRIADWVMLLAVHHGIMVHFGSLESTQETKVESRATLTLFLYSPNFPRAPILDGAR